MKMWVCFSCSFPRSVLGMAHEWGVLGINLISGWMVRKAHAPCYLEDRLALLSGKRRGERGRANLYSVLGTLLMRLIHFWLHICRVRRLLWSISRTNQDVGTRISITRLLWLRWAWDSIHSLPSSPLPHHLKPQSVQQSERKTRPIDFVWRW